MARYDRQCPACGEVISPKQIPIGESWGLRLSSMQSAVAEQSPVPKTGMGNYTFHRYQYLLFAWASRPNGHCRFIDKLCALIFLDKRTHLLNRLKST
jgi:hypothetical protein